MVQDPASLLTDLRSPDPETRYRAASQLAFVGPLPNEAVQMLVDALSDEGSFEEDLSDSYSGRWYETRCVSAAAEEALRHIVRPTRDAGALAQTLGPHLEALLESGSPRARRHAARLLKIRPEARAALVRALDDEAPLVREAAVETLTALRPKMSPLDDTDQLHRLLHLIWDPSNDVSRAAAEGIAVLADHPRFESAAVAALETWRPLFITEEKAMTQRISTCRALRHAPHDPGVADFLAQALLNVHDSTVVRFAAEALLASEVQLTETTLNALIDVAATPRLSWARPPLFSALVKQRAPAARLAEMLRPFAQHGEPGIIESAPLFEEVRTAAQVALRQLGA